MIILYVQKTVEYPCQNRNASGAANALIAAEMALAGITQTDELDLSMTGEEKNIYRVVEDENGQLVI